MQKSIVYVICTLAVMQAVLSTRVITAQPAFNPDSLKRVLASDVSGEDKDLALLKLAEGYFTWGDMAQSVLYCDQLVARGMKTGNKISMMKGYWIKGKTFLRNQVYDSAVMFCDSALAFSPEEATSSDLAAINITLGMALFYNEGPEAGIVSYRESYRLYAAVGDTTGLVKSLNGLGVMFKEMALYDSALIHYIELIKIAEEKGMEKSLAMGYLNMGILYMQLEDYERAFHYLNLSIPMNEKHYPNLVGLARMNIGLIHYAKKDYDAALVELRIAHNSYQSLEDRKKLADVLNNLGNVYIDIPNLDSAEYYYVRARDLFSELGCWYPYGQTLNNLGLLNIYRKNYSLAYQLLDSSLAVAIRTGNPELASTAYKNLYFGHKTQDDHQQALKYYLLHDSIQDMIYQLEKDRLMADLEMKYQNEKKQAQILALERDNLIKTKQNNIYLFTAIGIIALITFGLLYFRQRARKDRIIAQQRIRQLEEEKKLLAAKSLVEGQEEERKRIARELHDGLGVLLSTTRMQFSSIGDASPGARPLIEKASRLLEQASSDVRKISHNMMPGLLTKLGLYEAVADLFEKLSETEGLKVTAEIPEDAERMPENREIMLYRIIQELANNTLKHAQASNIELRMELHPGKMDVFYSDDGIGFNIEEKLMSKSIGLNSIQSRVNFLNGKMDVRSEPGKGAAFRFEIPV
ncbi:MAG: sensor histidine kinase [Bacteroidales bacterium]|nr:sensor histidine kinase [Bacteroidales bacterium]